MADPTATAGTVPLGNTEYPPPAGSVFVDVAGSDGNAGTIDMPKKTIAAACATGAPAVVVRGATGGKYKFYQEGGNTNPTTANPNPSTRNPGMMLRTGSQIIQNYPGEQVWIDGSTAFTGAWTASGGLWSHPYTMRFDRSHRFSSGQVDVNTGTAQQGAAFVDPALNPCAANPDMVLMDGVQLRQVNTKAQVVPGTFWVEGAYLTNPNPLWFQASNVWVADDPTKHVMSYANRTSWLQTAASNLLIRGLGVKNFATHITGFGGLYFTSAQATLENCYLQDFSAAAVWFSGAANMTLRHVTARRIGYGVTGGGKADNALFDGCDFQQINFRNFNPNGPALAVVKLSSCQGYTVKNSIFANSNCAHVWTDQTVNHLSVTNNRLLASGRQAVDVEGAAHALVAGNLITQAADVGIWNNDSDQGDYWNNTLVDCNRKYNSGAPFTIGQSNRRAADPAYAWMKDSRQPASYWSDPANQYVCQGYRWKNNVVVQSAGGHSQGVFSCQSQADNATYAPAGGPRKFQPNFGPDHAGNVYFWPAGSVQYPFIASNGGGVSPKVYPSLAAFQAATGLEKNSTQASVNPLNASFQVTDASLHPKAVALPSAIASALGQAVGVQHAGAFLTG